MIGPIYTIDIPPTVVTITSSMNIGLTTVSEPLAPPDPPPNTYSDTMAFVKANDPLEHLRIEEHRRRSKQMRKARRPHWRR